MDTFRELGEFGFIDRISTQGLVRPEGVLCGIGDDCAVFAVDETRVLLATADLMVEDVHFLLHATAPEGLGYKLLAVNLSDIAAMGGQPRDAIVSVAIPPEFDVGYMERVYEGLYACARRFGVNIAGGDTTRSPSKLMLSLTLLGRMETRAVCYRSGARPGDLLCTSGVLGDSAGGLAFVRGQDVNLTSEDRAYLLRRHHRPEPRVELGRALAATGAVTSMLDVSDGVASDLGHICERSGVSAIILSEKVPTSAPFRAFCRATSQDSLELALCGGEDYELLFTVRPDGMDRVEALNQEENLPPISVIGWIEAGEKNIYMEDSKGNRRPLETPGFDHFRTPPG